MLRNGSRLRKHYLRYKREEVKYLKLILSVRKSRTDLRPLFQW